MTTLSRKTANVVGLVLAIALAIGLAVMGEIARADQPRATAAIVQKGQPTPFWFRTPCAVEDSVNCYWDAGRRGNKRGRSFYIRDLRGPLTCLFYVDRKYAWKHDSCFPDNV